MGLSYQQALDFLFPRTTSIKFGLETTRALLAAVGDPHTVFPTIHIGGTNGKGSVSTLVAAALRARGFRVGLYTSPHLVSFRERIQVDGVPISEAAVAAWTERLMPEMLARQGTFFEATTAIALADFAARGVDLAVVEVGLGGRLDSTNVVTPLVSAVTKIELDHQKYLGDTLRRSPGRRPGSPSRGCPSSSGRPARRWSRCSAGRPGPPPAGSGGQPMSGCCRPATRGPGRWPWPAPTSGATPGWPTGS